MKVVVIQIVVFCLMVSSCNYFINRDEPVDSKHLLGNDYRLFQKTPAWNLAKAVQDEDEKKINEILSKNHQLINYQEPRFGSSLLMLTIKNQQIKSFKILLENKANIHIHDSYEGYSALMDVCNYNRYNIKFAKLLLQCGANVNDVQVDVEKEGKTRTPLMLASKEGNLDLVKLLVAHGANINYQNEFKQSALSECVIQNRYETAIYLLRKGADYNLPITYNEEQNKTYYLADELRFQMFSIGSTEYKLKMQIVAFLKSKGIDYRAIPIPEYAKEYAKENYPSSWEEYLAKY